jgi:hypothetical protein
MRRPFKVASARAIFGSVGDPLYAKEQTLPQWHALCIVFGRGDKTCGRFSACTDMGGHGGGGIRIFAAGSLDRCSKRAGSHICATGCPSASS